LRKEQDSQTQEVILMSEIRQLYTLEPPERPLPAALAFLRHARFRLQSDYLVKITRALDRLDDVQIWWRPNEASNSIGNLLLHLSGNVRQWIVAGVSAAPDVRTRAAEFTAQQTLNKQALLAQLTETLAEVDAVLAGLIAQIEMEQSDAPLQRVCVPQGFPQTVLDAVFHVVEHFSYHTGQIVYLAKQLSGEGTQFYDERVLNREQACEHGTIAALPSLT
jgi:uncharacterized damage-inducible protein DinB